MDKKKGKWLKEGFTLLELLVVLIVISILMAIIIPNIAGQKAKIEQQSRINIAEVIENQVHTYKMVEQDQEVSIQDLSNKGYITDKQVDQAEKLLNLHADTVINLPIDIPQNE